MLSSMEKEEYIKIVNDRLVGNSLNIMVNQINKFYECCDNKVELKKYNIGDRVFLPKGTLMHGTYKNYDGLLEIANNGLISSWFTLSRGSKYPSSVGVWNLNRDFYLDEYINYYSGGTMRLFNQANSDKETLVIPYNEMGNITNIIHSKNYLCWGVEQTKEARFLPSLVQNNVQIGIIFNGNNDQIKELLKGDILESTNINDSDVRDFVNEKYYEQFIIDRCNKDDFFTNRESAVLFGIPANFIEGILVGRDYEKDLEMLNKIKSLLPEVYICNLDGKVIY